MALHCVFSTWSDSDDARIHRLLRPVWNSAKQSRNEQRDESRGFVGSRGFAPRGGFEDSVTSPRAREFSRSMSSENWREAKRSGGGAAGGDEQDDGEGDWRRAGPRERWSESLPLLL